MFNECITTGYFPQAFKNAEVIPIYKSGQADMCSNYRPTFILNPFAKIFEKCLHDKLYNYFISKNLLSPSQYGFKKNISTAQAVNDTYNEILQYLNKKHTTCAVFLVLSKAFDTIDHNILINKSNKYGIRKCPLVLFENYLTMRYQYTVVNGVKSHNDLILCGVPQGFILGPLLFNVYVNDLPLVSNHEINLVADDTNLIISNKNDDYLQRVVNAEPVKIRNWMVLNKLPINYKKKLSTS